MVSNSSLSRHYKEVLERTLGLIFVCGNHGYRVIPILPKYITILFSILVCEVPHSDLLALLYIFASLTFSLPPSLSLTHSLLSLSFSLHMAAILSPSLYLPPFCLSLSIHYACSFRTIACLLFVKGACGLRKKNSHSSNRAISRRVCVSVCLYRK